MNRSLIVQDLKRHEGFVPHAYQDHLGYWTLGTGFLIDQRKGGAIPQAVNDFWLDYNIIQIESELRQRLTWWVTLSPNRRRAMVNMAYQLGVTGLMRFERMLAALERRDWAAAHAEALDSDWAVQTPERAREVAEWLRTE
mgnify:CR=1 FL=1